MEFELFAVSETVVRFDASSVLRLEDKHSTELKFWKNEDSNCS